MPAVTPRNRTKTAPAKGRSLAPKSPKKMTALKKAAPAPAPAKLARKPDSLSVAPKPKAIKISPNGKVLGRPRLERPPLAQVQTRVPSPLSDYLKMLSIERLPDQPAPFRTMQRMFESLFARFLDERPWSQGFAWRESHAVARFSGGEVTERTHWKQLNIQLPVDLAQRIETTAHKLDRSQSSFCYTALCWWAGALYPPVSSRSV